MAELGKLTVTILDMEEIMEIIHEALSAVPEWERAQLQERLNVVIARAQALKRARLP